MDIKRLETFWKLTCDEQPEGDYSHPDRATHDAAARAREMQDSGMPAAVLGRDDKVIQIDTDPEPASHDLANNAAACGRV